MSSITRRDALRGATAAAVVTGVTAAPLVAHAALAADPAVDLSRHFRAVCKAWWDAIDAFEEAAHSAGHSIFMTQKAVSTMTTR